MANASNSRLGRGVVVRGTIRGDGDLTIDGRVEGSLELSGEIEVGATGRVRAPISAERVTIRGAVAGDVRGGDAVILEEGARVVGDVNAPSVGIRPGGLLRGYVSTSGKAPTGASKQAARGARSAPAATHAPRAQRPASLQRGRDEAAVTAPAAPPQRAPAAVRPVERPAALPKPPARPTPRESPPSQRAVVEPIASPMTRASGKPTAIAVARESSGGPPPPVVPSLKKGARGSMKKKAGR